MLSGEPFLPNTAQLVDERDLSSQASFRFNTAVQKDSGERAWLFRQTVTAGWIYPRAGERQVTGHLGHGVNVSAPFHCDYGYNLSIGDNAAIGPDCQLLDSGRIVVGRNTKIGARVIISTLEEPTHMRPLEGSERTETARGVFIGENVYIGDGCIIKGGVRIGDNAIVHAGSVVVQASVHRLLPSENLRWQRISPCASERDNEEILTVRRTSRQTASSLATPRKLDRWTEKVECCALKHSIATDLLPTHRVTAPIDTVPLWCPTAERLS